MPSEPGRVAASKRVPEVLCVDTPPTVLLRGALRHSGSVGGRSSAVFKANSWRRRRAAFILGQHPFWTGLLTIGMPGSDHGIPDWAPTVADMLKNHGYVTAQYGKNHLADRDKHLPTGHGFDEFFGNL